jgi:putative molybdopterin biosynthesis protein
MRVCAVKRDARLRDDRCNIDGHDRDPMRKRGIHLQYSFEAHGQRDAALHNPLFDLLQAVQQHGSIRHAAQATGASYRHVWGQLKHWEGVLAEPLVSWVKGQPARLTPFAERLLWAERRARTRLTPHIEALRAELERVLAEALEGSQQVLTMYASHDLALPRLREHASARHGLHIELKFAGSIDCLRALGAGRCLVAGFHVPALHDGSKVFERAMKTLLKPGRHKLIGCTQRTQGLMIRQGNPLRIGGVTDLARPDVRFINRQPGSGTRLLIDHLLHAQRIDAASVRGYLDAPEDTHVAVAAAIASGAADAGPGIEAAARQFGLDFVPLLTEDYFLVCLKESLDHPAVQRLRAVLASAAWQHEIAQLAGYAPARSGEVLALTRALAWWHYRSAKRKTAARSGKRAVGERAVKERVQGAR